MFVFVAIDIVAIVVVETLLIILTYVVHIQLIFAYGKNNLKASQIVFSPPFKYPVGLVMKDIEVVN